MDRSRGHSHLRPPAAASRLTVYGWQLVELDICYMQEGEPTVAVAGLSDVTVSGPDGIQVPDQFLLWLSWPSEELRCRLVIHVDDGQAFTSTIVAVRPENYDRLEKPGSLTHVFALLAEAGHPAEIDRLVDIGVAIAAAELSTRLGGFRLPPVALEAFLRNESPAT